MGLLSRRCVFTAVQATSWAGSWLHSKDCIVEKIAIVLTGGFKLFYPIAWLKQINCWKCTISQPFGCHYQHLQLTQSFYVQPHVRIPCHVACTEAEGKEYIFGHPLPNRRQYYVVSVLQADIPSDYFICDNFQTACAFTQAVLAMPAQQTTPCLMERRVVLRIISQCVLADP